MQQDWRKRHLGLFALLAVLLTLGALVQDFRFDRSLERERSALVTVEREIGALQVALADFRAAQAGYVAIGQGPEFWTRLAHDLASRLEAGLTQLREAATADDARAAYDMALGALGNLSGLDARAREYVLADQRFLAADVVFIESLEVSRRLGGELDRVRTLEAAAAEARMARTGWLRLALNAFAMGVVLLVGLGVGRQRPAASEAALTAQMIRDLPPPVKPATPLTRPAPAPPPPPPAPAVNLPDAAELCVDLARVMDGRDVPALLERAAQVLDAKGVIVWVADPVGAVLRPSLAHGYSERMLARLGSLEIDADNVTSLAFRSMRPQTMAGTTPGAAGAVAVPLVTAAGCNGVLSAELRNGRPAPELLALTRIVAAQFATLIAPADVAQKVAEA